MLGIINRNVTAETFRIWILTHFKFFLRSSCMYSHLEYAPTGILELS